MTVAEFLDWPGDGSPVRYELVDGVLRAQEAPSDTHGTIHGNLAAAIRSHLKAKRPGCRVVVTPGIQPWVRADWNYREPDLAVTCAPNRADTRLTPEPLLLIEILSPSNAAATWENVRAYTTIPTVAEILVVYSTARKAELLRRSPKGTWPANPETITAGDVPLDCIALWLPFDEVYADTHLE